MSAPNGTLSGDGAGTGAPGARRLRIFVTGIGGLIGSTLAEIAHGVGHSVYGIDSDQRGRWFGHAGSVTWRIDQLVRMGIRVVRADFRERLRLVDGADLVVHCASQPSHDFSRTHVLEDSAINYTGTVALLEAVRTHAPRAVFAFLSTNKVYGAAVNDWAYRIVGERLVPEPVGRHPLGVDESMRVDASTHTPFGVSKLAADLMVQEYRRTFGLTTVSFRCGCLTGPGGTAVEMQGFLGYLVHCAVTGKPYTIYGLDGYQVRDNIDAGDVARAVLAYAAAPKADVYNLGGGPANAISIREAIAYLRDRHGCSFEATTGPVRWADHKWWITNTARFERDYPSWTRKPITEIIDALVATERARLSATHPAENHHAVG